MSTSVKLLSLCVLPGSATRVRAVRPDLLLLATRKGVAAMEVLHERCAGMDVSKRDVKVCVRVPSRYAGRHHSEVKTFGAMTGQILQLREYLIEQQVTRVVMESTGEYWKPFYYLLEDGPFEVLLVNPRHVKNMPGRKTDVSDAQWLAELAAHDLVRASLVPPPPIRILRDLTRTHTDLTRDRTREYNRLQGVLEDAGIKLTAVTSTVNGVSARSMLEALVAGERDGTVLAELAQKRLRSKRDLLAEALVGRFADHHAFMVSLHLKVIDQLTTAIAELTERIEVVIEPFRKSIALLQTVPGFSHRTAVTVFAEIGGEVGKFPTPAHLASWAGVCPGHHQSADRIKSAHTRPGNPYLKGALGIAAMAASRTQDTFLARRFARIRARGGGSRAVVAVEHSILISVHEMLTRQQPYREPPLSTRRPDPQKALRRITSQANELGFTVRFDPIPRAS